MIVYPYGMALARVTYAAPRRRPVACSCRSYSDRRRTRASTGEPATELVTSARCDRSCDAPLAIKTVAPGDAGLRVYLPGFTVNVESLRLEVAAEPRPKDRCWKPTAPTCSSSPRPPARGNRAPAEEAVRPAQGREADRRGRIRRECVRDEEVPSSSSTCPGRRETFADRQRTDEPLSCLRHGRDRRRGTGRSCRSGRLKRRRHRLCGVAGDPSVARPGVVRGGPTPRGRLPQRASAWGPCWSPTR